MTESSSRTGSLPFALLIPILGFGALVLFMFFWNGRQAGLLTEWWREKTAKAAWETIPNLSGCTPRELIEHPDRTEAFLPGAGIRAMGFINPRGWVVEPFGIDRKRLASIGPFPRHGVTVLPAEESLMVARLPMRSGGPSKRLVSESIPGPATESPVPPGNVSEEDRPGWGMGHGGGPFETVFLMSGNGVPPVGPLILQRWLWPVVWAAGSVMWIWLYRHRERMADLERKRQRESHLAVVGQASARLAHEIKNPLGAIRGAAQHAMKKPLSETQLDMLRLIEKETGRLEELARGVLDFARPYVLRPVNCNLGILIQDVLSGLMLQSPTPEVKLNGAEHPILLQCDPAAITQILQNLLDNAGAASRNAGTSEPVVVEVGQSSGDVLIRILDRGEGLSDEIREHLFEPFYSTKTKGYGLGLVVSRRLAEAHGGSLQLDPRDGGGCSAELRIPAKAAS